MTRYIDGRGDLGGEGGWDSIWVFDHFHTVPTPELETCFEAWTISATLARDTQNVKIGQMVGCNGYRNPRSTPRWPLRWTWPATAGCTRV